MASVNFSNGKHKGATAAKAQFRHSAEDERSQTNHSNKQIDKTKTKDNFSLKDLSYSDLCETYDERIKMLDESTNKNKRKDRVTLFSLNIPAPQDLSEQDLKEWFAKVGGILEEQYGSDNLLDMPVHVDEIHEYVNPKTKEVEISRAHGHAYLIPERDGQLNGKWFSSRANINKLNRAIHEMSERDFGVYFMTGKKTKSNSKVEELKAESLKAEIELLEEKQEVLQTEIADLEPKRKRVKQELDEAESKKAVVEKEAYDAGFKAHTLARDLEQAMGRPSSRRSLDEVVEDAEEHFKSAGEREAALARREAEISRRSLEMRQKEQEADKLIETLRATVEVPSSKESWMVDWFKNHVPKTYAACEVTYQKVIGTRDRIIEKRNRIFGEAESIVQDAKREQGLDNNYGE